MEIHVAIERADREGFTREPPKTLKSQVRYLLEQLGSAKAVAQEIGVTADSVNRYRRGARKHARADVAAKIDDAVRQRWQPQVRKRRQRQAATTGGITVETRARFGYTAPVGTTDDGRFRRLTVHLPPEYARRLFDARDGGASDQEMRGIIAEGFKDVYFQDGGARAMGLSDVAVRCRNRVRDGDSGACCIPASPV
ncbi:XRE family transcriptional regulator [Streptomyces hygroscopicus]|uniref:telomere-protecting terminal protein Tpg n=1 Tax=Streptomyces hygroscopicus TaxID=1912 RepID=UPI0033DABE56